MTATRLPARSTSWSQRAEWNAGPSKSPKPGMSGQLRPVELADGADRPRWPSSVSSRAVGGAHDDGPAQVVVGPRRRHDLGAEADVLAQAERVGACRGSTRAARPGSRSGTASRGAARTSSCSCGSGCRPGSPDSWFSYQVPPTSSFFSKIANGTPACCSRCAASRPDMPAPMISTVKSTSGATSSLCHVGRPAVLAAVGELLLEQRQVRAPCRRRRRRTP